MVGHGSQDLANSVGHRLSRKEKNERDVDAEGKLSTVRGVDFYITLLRDKKLLSTFSPAF